MEYKLLKLHYNVLIKRKKESRIVVTLGEGEGNSVWEGTWDNFCGIGKVLFLDLVWVLYFTMRIKKKKRYSRLRKSSGNRLPILIISIINKALKL